LDLRLPSTPSRATTEWRGAAWGGRLPRDTPNPGSSMRSESLPHIFGGPDRRPLFEPQETR
jgi:hypothetical protein